MVSLVQILENSIFMSFAELDSFDGTPQKKLKFNGMKLSISQFTHTTPQITDIEISLYEVDIYCKTTNVN